MTERNISDRLSNRARLPEPTEAEQQAAFALRGLYVALVQQDFSHDEAITIVVNVAKTITAEV